MAYTHNPNHAEEAVALLHSQHQHDEDLKNFVRALMKPFQDLEDALPGLYTAFDLDNILTSLIEDVYANNDELVTANNGQNVWVGSTSGITDRLTRLGGVIGEQRNGRFDREYLAFVIARTYINRSLGAGGDLYAIARALLGPTNNTLRLEPIYPAGYRLNVTGNRLEFPWDMTVPADFVASVLADMLLEATGAGVSLEVLFQASDDAHTFTLSSTDASEFDVNMGLAADDLGTTGGQFIGLELRED